LLVNIKQGLEFEGFCVNNLGRENVCEMWNVGFIGKLCVRVGNVKGRFRVMQVRQKQGDNDQQIGSKSK